MENKRRFILNIVSLIGVIATFVCLSFPAVNEFNGYEMFKAFDTVKDFVAVLVIMNLVLLALLFVSVVLKMLCEFNIIKCEKFIEVINWVCFGLACLIAVIFIVSVFVMVAQIKKIVGLKFSLGAYLFMITTLVSFVPALLNTMFDTKIE